MDKSKVCVVGAAQMSPNDESIIVNMQRIIAMMEKAAADGIQLLAFAELAFTPFFPVKYVRDFDHYFMTVDSDPIRTVCEKARELNMTVVIGFAEKEGVHYFNTAIIIDTQGVIVGKYRKMHMPAPMISEQMGNFEKIYFTPGDLGYPVTQTGGISIGLQICYDRHFPEGYRVQALKGADIIFNLTATTVYGSFDWRSDVWKLLLRARAFENGVFVVGINKTGMEYGKDYYGHSMIISPLGADILAFAERSLEDTLIKAELNMASRFEAYLRLPYARDRRYEDDHLLESSTPY